MLIENCSWNWTLRWCWVFKKINSICMMSEGTIDSGTLHVTCWKHKYMGGEDGCVRGGWRPSLGLICETVNSVGRGNFMFVSKKSGNFRNLWLWRPWMFEIDGSFICSFHVHMEYAVCWYNCECAKMWRYRVYLLVPVVHVSKFAVRTLFVLFLGVYPGRWSIPGSLSLYLEWLGLSASGAPACYSS